MDLLFSEQPPTDLAADLLVVGATPAWEEDLAALDAALDGHLLAWAKRKGFGGKTGDTVLLPTLGKIAAETIQLVGLGARSDREVIEAAGLGGRHARSLGATTVGLALGPLSAVLAARVAETVGAGNYAYDRHKKEDGRKAAAESLTLLGSGLEADERWANAVRIRAQWQTFARDLVNAPADEIYPETLADAARTLADIEGVEVEVWDIARCEAEGLVGIVAVGRGSERPGCLIHVTYRPANPTTHIALVGKGVTFDSGGLSLKTSAGMQTMRCDMGGSATVLAATAAIAELGIPVSVDCFVGAVENMNSGKSYKLGDILHYANGVSVEIHNTDAEGRLVLADCLIQASKVEGVQQIVDAATLTGACAVAVGTDFAGLFTADEPLCAALLAAAEANAEGLWRLPLHQPYKSLLRADWAQIKNVGAREGGATTAALFLQHFVDAPAWAHLDIAGNAFLDKSNRYYAAGGTGEIVRTLVSWVESLGD